MSYIQVLKIALLFFPFVALVISAPFIIMQYHKYGSISFFKGLIIYSFTLYFMCAYFLIILPLPKRSDVALLTTPRTQLIPFSFIIDFIKNSTFNIRDIHTYLPALKSSYFYVPIYNIFLTLPFGMYLRYYFKCNFKKTLLFSFLLSLFFELTQLSGLYFIYPRGYRLFDVDDLFLNTLGGVIGYLIAGPTIKILPKLERVEKAAKERGKKISGLRRTTAFFFDLFLFSLICGKSIYDSKFYISFGLMILYYLILPLLLKGSTLGEKFLNMKVVDYQDKFNPIRFTFRQLIIFVLYLGIPYLISHTVETVSIDDEMIEFISVLGIGVLFIFYFVTALKYFFSQKPMIYEKISKTKLVSTIISD